MNDPRIKAASISDRQHVFKDTTVRNNGNSVLFVRLSDSSTVKIFPGGSLNYLKIFEHNQRNLILLKGKAVFYVTKDKKRPFTVYAGNTATTALGTIFTVNKDAVTNSVNVHLYKGAVVIKEHSESAEGKVLAYLKPGNEFCNLCEENYTRMNETPKPRNQTVSVSEASAHISFDNVPLSEVFDSIQVKEHIHFYYKKKDIDNISYTGVYDIKKENLYEFLNTVALLNNLSIHTTDSLTYRVNVKN